MLKINIRYLKIGTEIGINKRPIINVFVFTFETEDSETKYLVCLDACR